MGYIDGLVSIVTPVYNGESFVSRFLESVLSQTYSYVEMILVDDGSKDRTVETAKKFVTRFEERGYSYKIVCAEHLCAAGAVSHGLQYVSGEYLIWPDSDDVLLPESIENRVSFLSEHPDYNVVRSRSKYVNESDESEAPRDEKEGDLSKQDLFFDILESKTFVCCGCYMVRTSTLFELYPSRQIPIYDVGQNFQMLLPICYSNKCATLDKVLYVVYKRAASHSRRFLTREQEEKKYSDYESLLDDIIKIAHISDENDLKRIRVWKVNRRYRLAEKYLDYKRMNLAAHELFAIGAVSLKEYTKMRVSTMWMGKGAKVLRFIHKARLKLLNK